jgi:hypothetical protein
VASYLPPAQHHKSDCPYCNYISQNPTRCPLLCCDRSSSLARSHSSRNFDKTNEGHACTARGFSFRSIVPQQTTTMSANPSPTGGAPKNPKKPTPPPTSMLRRSGPGIMLGGLAIGLTYAYFATRAPGKPGMRASLPARLR